MTISDPYRIADNELRELLRYQRPSPLASFLLPLAACPFHSLKGRCNFSQCSISPELIHTDLYLTSGRQGRSAASVAMADYLNQNPSGSESEDDDFNPAPHVEDDDAADESDDDGKKDNGPKRNGNLEVEDDDDDVDQGNASRGRRTAADDDEDGAEEEADNGGGGVNEDNADEDADEDDEDEDEDEEDVQVRTAVLSIATVHLVAFCSTAEVHV